MWNMRHMTSGRLLLSLAVSLLCGCATRSANHRQSTRLITAPTVTYLQKSTDAVRTLQTWYVPSTGTYATTGWWNSANAITVLADYSRLAKSKEYDAVFANTFIAAQRKNPGFLNNFYDDEGWWALAWTDVYDLTGNPRYLAMAESIFADMTGGWNDTCGGGIWWSKDRQYKNAIANELFLSVAAHLANRTSGVSRSEYLNWGKKEWTWFRASGLINSEHLINDGLGSPRGKTAGARCTNNGRTIWSYNQGVVLGGLTELSAADHDPSLLRIARTIASAAITHRSDGNGILQDPCEPRCGADGVQFKGIFVCNLVLLDKASPQAAYKLFIDRNADAIWNDARGPEFQLGQVWSGPFESANAGSQSSALDAMVGAAALQKRTAGR